MLIVFGALPGTGKTTLARAVAKEQRATYLRIDTIEQALRSSGMLSNDVGVSGLRKNWWFQLIMGSGLAWDGWIVRRAAGSLCIARHRREVFCGSA
jgi:hypothetical protein